jgi:hypothetical protein
MITLDNVTLFQLNGVDPEIGVKALKYSSRKINFAKTVLLSTRKPSNLTNDIEFYCVDEMDHTDSSRLHFGPDNFLKYIDTEYYLSIQTDGFVINPEMWTDEFLEYDYIGAPWPALSWCSKNRVGNGGFRLESRKLLELCSRIKYDEYNGMHDDVLISNVCKEYFESHGCKFPSIELAARFSLELEIPEVEHDLKKCFGFHGKHTQQAKNLCNMINDYEY